MTTRTPLLSTGALDPLSVALPITISLVTVGLYLATRHPLVLTLCPWFIALALAGAAYRSALKIGPSHLTPLALAVIGLPVGLSVGGALNAVFGPAHGPVPPDFVPAMGLLGAWVYFTAGLVMDLWWCENWVSRETARRRCVWGVLLVIAGLTGLSVAAPLTVS